MTTIDLDAIEARAAAATGPTGGTTWIVERAATSYEVYSGPLSEVSYDIATHIFSKSDAEFIAAARSDVPTLVAEVERLRAIVDAHRRLLHETQTAAARSASIVEAVANIVENANPDWTDDEGLPITPGSFLDVLPKPSVAHEFVGHAEVDGCVHSSLGVDSTYCGRPEREHR